MGGMNVSQLMSMLAEAGLAVADRLTYEATRAGKIGAYARREQEWAFQSNVAAGEINQVYKHVRRGHPKSPQGGRLHVEMPIDISNVMLVCPKTNEKSRVGERSPTRLSYSQVRSRETKRSAT